MKFKLTTLLFSSALTWGLLTSSYDNHYDDDNGKAGATGSPGESTCNQSGCHTGTTVNGGGGSVSISSSNMTDWNYVPGQSYTISVTVAETGRSLFGLGVEALKSNGDNAGTLQAGTGTQIKTKTVQGFSRKNIVHNLNTGASSNSHTFTFTWVAPDTDVGDVTFYVAGNATNSDGDEAGDHIYTTTQVATAAVSVFELDNADLQLELYPNPANDQLNVKFNLTQSGNVDLKIFDARGQLIRVLNSSNMSAGAQSNSFDVSDLPQGVYMFQVLVDNKVNCSKIFQTI